MTAKCSDVKCQADGPYLYYGSVPLCGFHYAGLCNIVSAEKARLITRDDLDTGWAYILRLPGGRGRWAKIGTSKSLYRRLTEITRDAGGPVEVLSVEPGGRRREAELHIRFDHLRFKMAPGERFHLDPDLLEYAVNTGIAVAAVPDVRKYGVSHAASHQSV